MTPEIKTIVAAIDLQDDLHDAVLLAAGGLSRRPGVKLCVVDVWPRLKNVGFPYARHAEIKEIEHDSERREALSMGLRKRIGEVVPEAQIDVITGDVEDALHLYLRETHADLLVIGTHQKSFWRRLMEGSTSHDLVHEAPCAVFLVTPDYAKTLS